MDFDPFASDIVKLTELYPKLTVIVVMLSAWQSRMQMGQTPWLTRYNSAA